MSFTPFTVNTVAEMNISYTPSKREFKYAVVTSKKAFEFLWNLWNLNTVNLLEEVVVLYFNRSSKLIGYIRLAVGGITSTVVDVRLILGIALKSGANGFIVAHNHPSGNIHPSNADIEVCNKINAAAKVMDLLLMDFIIIAPSGDYSNCPDGYSFADNGHL